MSPSNCNLTVSSGSNWGMVWTSVAATYGSVGAHYSTMLNSQYWTFGQVQGNLFAGFFDNLRFYGPSDYAYAQLTVSGNAGDFIDGAAPNLQVTLNSSPLDVPFSGYGPDPFSITTALLPLNGKRLALSLTVGGRWSVPFSIPGGAVDFDGRVNRIQLFDSRGIPISSVIYSDDSGTAYPVDGGVLGPEPVPEVSSVTLLATMMVVIGYCRRRYRRGSGTERFQVH